MLIAQNEDIEIFKDQPYFIIASPSLKLSGNPLDKTQYTGFSAASLTDDHWTDGIIKNGERNIILFKYSEALYQKIDSSQNIICNKETYEIIDVTYDANWLRVTVDKSAENCCYPNKLLFK